VELLAEPSGAGCHGADVGFMPRSVPAEPEWTAYLREHGEHASPPVMERLKKSARERGLWNLFLPAVSG